MPAPFPRWANRAYGLGLASVAVGASTLLIAPMVYIRTPYGTHQFTTVEQPVEFDHRHHVRDDGIACLYCHSGAESQANAGIPSTALCMGCHGQIWPRSELLAPVRESYFSGTPISWKRVYALPDFVYFHHGVHVRGGIDCARCHGQVQDMARVYRVPPLTMAWCLDCHRDPPGAVNHGYDLTSLTTCSACHR
jgi:predicted CXXCH cytochrome family protein